MTDLSDLSTLIAYLMGSGGIIEPRLVGDVTGDCHIDLSDLSTMVSFLTGAGRQFRVGCQ